MSWWIGVEIDTGGEEPTDLSDRNVTYNVASMFIRALAIPEPGIHNDQCRCGKPYSTRVDGEWVTRVDNDHEYGLRALHGAPCSEAAGAISTALARMDADPDTYRAMNPANGWGSFESAREDLAWLLARCKAAPKGSVYIH